jgi:hypothetical protein
MDETFATTSRPWPNSASGPAQLINGVYQVAPTQAGRFVAIGAPIPETLQNVVVNARFRKIGGPTGGGYGVIVRDQTRTPQNGTIQDGQYYVLEVGDKGEVGIWRRDGDHWVDLLPWQRADAVKTGTGPTNELTVQANGPRLSLAVNGTQVATRSDPTYTAGDVGVFVGGDGNVAALERFTVEKD